MLGVEVAVLLVFEVELVMGPMVLAGGGGGAADDDADVITVVAAPENSRTLLLPVSETHRFP